MKLGQWDIFCKVIDNFGDIGVCWRLACDLASRGLAVRLWVDDASALAWMAPSGHVGVQVLPWSLPLDLQAANLKVSPCEVLIEAFGCDAAPEFIAACARSAGAGGTKPVWINLEYLSAEPYVERSHQLPSPVRDGPAAGWTKWFFYPGFAPRTGGLLREPGLFERQAAFDCSAWLASRGIRRQEKDTLVSLFCYEPPALAGLLAQFERDGLNGRPVQLLVAAGRAGKAVKACYEHKNGLECLSAGHGMLSISYLPLLTQSDFDHLLQACDLNFVRGEDSVIRALWAGKPFVWQIYPQHDGAHLLKLDAFLEAMQAPASWQRFHHDWNAANAGLPCEGLADLASWTPSVEAARTRLGAQPDLGTSLLQFAAKNR